jgi:hypothetical protein
MNNTEVFRKFILKQIAGEVVYSKENHSFQLSVRHISNSIREAIYAEGHKWEMTDKAIEDFINTVIKNVEISYKQNRQFIQYVNVARDLNPGLELWLEGSETGHGKAQLHLLYLGSSASPGHCRFMVLESTRLGLQPEDIVEPADNTLWAVGHPVMLNVYRQGVRYPDTERVYRTYQLENIIKVMPSMVHEVIDSCREFSFIEHVAEQQDEAVGKSLTFGRNPMSLLLHEYSRLLPIYIDFDKEGVGEFRSVADAVFAPSKVRDSLFDVTNDTLRHHSLSITTQTPGKLHLDSCRQQLSLIQHACAKATIS